MKKLTQAERLFVVESRISYLEKAIADLNRRVKDLEKPRALTKQEILDAGGIISLGGR